MGRERERGRETLMCERYIHCISHTPKEESGPQSRHVPGGGIEPETFWLQAWTQSTEPHQLGLGFSSSSSS